MTEVLFVCVHNAGRSQMAAAFMQQIAAGGMGVHSAGSRPASAVNPVVVQAMAERGIDISRERPKQLSEAGVRRADVVITMGCGDECPYFPGTRYIDWDLPDPAGQPLAVVRGIRDDIERRVRALLAELVSD